MATNGVFQSVDGVGGYLHSYCTRSGPTGLQPGGQYEVTNKESLALVILPSISGDMPPLAPVTLHFPKRRHWSQSELRAGHSSPPAQAAPGDLSSAGGLGTGLCCLPPPLTVFCLSAVWHVFLAPLPLHTCHDTGRPTQPGSP